MDLLEEGVGVSTLASDLGEDEIREVLTNALDDG